MRKQPAAGLGPVTVHPATHSGVGLRQKRFRRACQNALDTGHVGRLQRPRCVIRVSDNSGERACKLLTADLVIIRMPDMLGGQIRSQHDIQNDSPKTIRKDLH